MQDEIRAAGGDATFVTCDVSDHTSVEAAVSQTDSAMFVRTDVTVEADVKAMVEATVRRWGRLDDGGLTAARGSRAQLRERFERRVAFLPGTE